MGDFITIISGLGTWILIGNAIGGAKGFFIGFACGFVVFIVVAFITESNEDKARERKKKMFYQSEDDRLRKQFPEEDPGPISRGKCPDCGYEPISMSCVTCPKCGCNNFVRELRGMRIGLCTHCQGQSYECHWCDGKGMAYQHKVVDYRSGVVTWTE